MPATATYDLEYRAREDDAWYSVSVNLSDDGKTLEVMLQCLGVWNLRHTSGEFKSIAQVDELLERFRPVSRQVQDNECDKLIKGMIVCAALSYRSDDLRFYDAVVEDRGDLSAYIGDGPITAVQHRKHSFTDGEEECLCSVMLCWLHGPMLGNITLVKIADVCTIQAAALANPSIISFSKLTKDRILADYSESCTVSEHCTTAPGLGGPMSCKEHICFSLNEKSSSPRRLQDTEVENYCCERGKERFRLVSDRGSDEDVGGSDSVNSCGCYFVLIGNLEKDLSTSSMKQFILDHTHVSARAYLFPSGSSVPSGDGAIASDSIENIEKIYDFLVHPEHLIVSAGGRPWVVCEKVLDGIDGSWGAALGSLLSQSQDEFQFPRKQDLEVVHFGTEAYSIAKQLRDLFVDFLDHEKLLYQALALEETEILKSAQLGRPLHIR